MKVTYNGFTGELVKLEMSKTGKDGVTSIPIYFTCGLTEATVSSHKWFYDLSIYDSEKQVTHSFTSVRLEDVKFSGGEVTFGE